MSESLFTIEGNALIANGSLDFSRLISQQTSIFHQVDELLGGTETDIVIDLSTVENIPSTAMGICMAAARKAQELNKHLTIRIKQKHAGAVGLTGLHQLVCVDLV
ncbi:MAG: STAS domain-containing protein [Planctomycetota bacterium]|jgi:ABC-type transporter Mla MlaB component